MNHYHYAAAAYFTFVLGWGVHAWGRASMTIQSSLSGITTYARYMRINGNIVAGRFVLAACGLGLLSDYDYIMPWVGGFSTTAASFFAHHPGPLPLIWPVTGILGWFADSGIDMAFAFASKWWPKLQNEIPPTLGSTIQKQIDNPSKTA